MQMQRSGAAAPLPATSSATFLQFVLSPQLERALLAKHFPQYGALRRHQRAAVAAVLAGRDAVVLAPTGGGKSLCFQFAAMALPGITIVCSPLIALIHAQVDGQFSMNARSLFVPTRYCLVSCV